MRSVVQRVKQASVKVDGELVGAIERGLLVFLGVGENDSGKDLLWMVEKLINLRIFSDEAGKMNCSVRDVSGGILLISQFTLYGDCRKGNRPSFSGAGAPDMAKALYEQAASALRERGLVVATGIFQAEMEVGLINDGPVTLLLDSHKSF